MWYKDASEQVDVENYYITGGMLLPSFYQNYWYGMQQVAGKWRYIDPTGPVIRPSTYRLAPAGACVLPSLVGQQQQLTSHDTHAHILSPLPFR